MIYLSDERKEPTTKNTLPSKTLIQTFSLSLFFKSIYFNWRLITILWWFLPYIDRNQPREYMHPSSRNPLPPPSPFHPFGLSQCTSFGCPVSHIELGLVIYFTYDNIHVSMLFSQIFPPSPSPTDSKRLFCSSVSLAVSHTQSLLPSF